MEPALKTRLIGAAVLIALAVIIVPMFFSGSPSQTDDGKTVSLALPASPDQELITRSMRVTSPSPASSTPLAAMVVTNPDHLATLDLPSRHPPETHPKNALQPIVPPATAVQQATQRTSAAPVQSRPSSTSATKPATKPVADKRAASASAVVPGRAANSIYRVSLGAYSDNSNVRNLLQRVRKLGYGVHTDTVTISGKSVVRISAGPFSTRAAAETARLHLKQAIPNAPARLLSTAHEQKGDAPASALPAGHVGGWAVQIGAYSHKTDASALRDKLRKVGFDSYIDDVRRDGHTLWRVRVGPQTQRVDAMGIRDELKSKLKLGSVVVTVP